jgi:hypothetical protein
VIEMKLPYQDPLVRATPGERVIPEPPRRGEPGGEPCRICAGAVTQAVWSDGLWTLHPPVNGSLPGAVWLASREHVDSFADLPPVAAADFGKIAGRVERAILALGGIARCTCTGGETVVPTSMCGSSRGPSACWRPRG